MWKIIFVECPPVGGRGGLTRGAFYSQTHFQKMQGGKRVEVQKTADTGNSGCLC